MADPPSPDADRPRLMALVIEDSITERTLLTALARRNGFDVVGAENGAQALAQAEARAPDIVLLDVHLPDMDGLVLLSQLRAEMPYVPVVVISASAEPAQVEAALELGAVNFMFKPVKAREVRFILDRIARALREEAGLQEVLTTIVERQTRLEMPSDPSAIPRIVTYLGREVRYHYPGHRIPVPDIKLALYEALANAIEHGNLEIDFEGKAEAMMDPGVLACLIRNRLQDPRMGSRRVYVDVIYRPAEVEYRVRDEGPGFDPASFEREAALADVNALHGRGLALIHHYMDAVAWDERGNEIRMVRRLARQEP
ncbi:MAG: response regulator [Planctomycetota bacterium]